MELTTVAAQVRFGDGDQLAITGSRRVLGGSGEGFWVAGQERCGHEQRCGGGDSGPVKDLRGRAGMVTDQTVEETGVVVGHTRTVYLGAHGAPTAASVPYSQRVLTVAVVGAVEARRDGERLSVPAGTVIRLPARPALVAGSNALVYVLLEVS